MRSRQVLTAIAICLGLALMLYFCALPGDLPADVDGNTGLAGTYSVNGSDPLGVEYSGTVVINGTDNPSQFSIEWIITGAIQRGTGITNGSTFEVNWETVTSGGGTGTGTASYTIHDDGRLTGERTIDGSNEIGSEELFPDA